MKAQRSLLAPALTLLSLPLLTANSHVGKILISAQFTRGFLIGAGIMMDVFAVVWAIQAAHAAKQTPPQPTPDAQ